MAWIWLISAGFNEVLFATFLKLSDGFSKPIYTAAFVVTAALSFFCLTKAMLTIRSELPTRYGPVSVQLE